MSRKINQIRHVLFDPRLPLEHDAICENPLLKIKAFIFYIVLVPKLKAPSIALAILLVRRADKITFLVSRELFTTLRIIHLVLSMSFFYLKLIIFIT